MTVSGDRVEIIHRGAWSHGLGPDFKDALLLFNDRELRSGSVEIHLRTRGWVDHGHHLNTRYESVILHVVGHHDGRETRRLDGALVPIVEVGPASAYPMPDFALWDWDRVGGEICAARTAATNPAALRQTLIQLGDSRLATRTAKIEARLQVERPAEILWQELLDGLGFSRNREPMRALARALPIVALEDIVRATGGDSLAATRGLLLGAAGFLPLSAPDTLTGGLTPDGVSTLEASWREWRAPFLESVLLPTEWNLARVRPANHPVPRLLAAANMVASANARGGLTAAVLEIVADEADPVLALRHLTAAPASHGIGADRAIDMLASGVLPFVHALASDSGDQALGEAAARHWERLPAPAANDVTRRAARQVAGGTPLGKIGARGSQGLIHLDTALCQPRRCFECPVAALELAVKEIHSGCQR